MSTISQNQQNQNLPEEYPWYDSVCRHFSQSEKIPAAFFVCDELVSVHPHFSTGTSSHYELLTNFNINPGTISIAETKGHLLYGALWIPKTRFCSIIIGPVKTYKASDDDYIRLLPAPDSLDEDTAQILNAYIHASPIVSYEQLYNKLAFLNFIVNGLESESLEEYSSHSNAFVETVKKTQETDIYQDREFSVLHNNYSYEQEFLRNITLGKQTDVKELLKEGAPYLFRAKYSLNEMRTLKDDFILTVTLVSRAAISGGLDVETALQLCDHYVITVERCDSMEKIHNLFSTMISDYAGRTARYALPANTPALVTECVNYINANLTKPITTQSVAKHFEKRREYLSMQFKQYTGYPISEFIMRQRVENAKALLRYTNFSLAQISFHLCFSDQSHFQRVFKKYMDTTPNAFRQAAESQNV